MAELLPCPLCGEEVSIDREYIFCDYCHLICRIDDRIYNGEAETYQEARQQAIDCWNTRTPKETHEKHTQIHDNTPKERGGEK